MSVGFSGNRSVALKAFAVSALFACGGEPAGPDDDDPTAAAVALVQAPPATARSGVPFDPAPRVRLVDANGAAVSAAGVRITASVDGGSLVGTAVATTGADGTAQFPGLAVSSLAGTRHLAFSAPGLAAASHELAITAGLPAAMVANSVTMQSGLVGRAVAAPPSVKVTDAAGNAVAAALVGFAVTTGDGSLTAAATSSDAEGIATVGSWTLGALAGANSVRASVSGVAGIGVSFHASGTLVAAARVELHEGATQTVDLGGDVPVRPAVRVLDAQGLPAAGVVVNFALGEGSGAYAGLVQTTDVMGIARVGMWRIGDLVQRYTMHALVPGADGSPVVFEAIGRGIGNITAHAAGYQVAPVGQPVPVRPAARILDRFGAPVPGVTVTFRVVSGGGTLTGATQVTDASGVATVGSWTLGPFGGPQSVSAEADDVGGGPAMFGVEAQYPVQTATMSALTSLNQTARIRTVVPEAPTVRIVTDAGTPVANYPVTFTAEGGTVANPSTYTDANGVASAGSWTMPSTLGTYDVIANAPNVLASGIRFHAVVTPGLPARIYFNPDDEIATATVGTAAPSIPFAYVVDAGDNPVPGVQVTFTVASGSLTGNVKETSAGGSAKPDGWVLGPAAGTQTLTATVAGLTPANRAINAVAAPPASITLVSGDNQTAGVRRLLPNDLVVRFADQYGNPVPDQVPAISLPNGGQVSDVRKSGADGLAKFRVRLGSTPGLQSIIVSSSGVPGSVTFSATATPVISNFSIQLRYITAVPTSQQAYFTTAAARWADIILGDVPDLAVSLGANTCVGDQPAINEVVDDIVIFIDIRPIDGVGNVLGSAGPCVIRTSSDLPAVAVIQLDAADVASMASNGTLASVALHEMGHALGIVSEVWTRRGLLTGAGTSNPLFTGANAVTAYGDIGGGGNVPVENTGGDGTADTHWRESVFTNELMTGFINAGANPLSLVTIGSLADIGYQVDYGTAEHFGFGPNFLRAPAGAVQRIREVPLKGPIIEMSADGTVVPHGKR